MAFETEWVRGSLDDPVEAATFAMLRIVLDGQIVTRLYDRVAGGERDSINVALYPFALNIAKHWWKLLYEPRKSAHKDSLADVSHSLDVFMTGFAFPAINLWSDGEDAVSFEIPDFKQKFSSIEFLPIEHRDVVLSRGEVESNLFELISKVIDRLPRSPNGAELREVWGRLSASLRDREERRYCVAAGQLGLDPYDPDLFDVASLSDELSDRLFSDVCEAATPREVGDAIAWAREGVRRLVTISDVVGELGDPAPRDPKTPIWDHGYKKARSLRRHLHLDGMSPRRVVDEIFAGAVRGEHVHQLPHPYSLRAITARHDRALKIALPNVSAKMRRSTLCRALYVAWRTDENESSAVTTAGTLDQQASRAFAAELLAPEEQLRQYAGTDGLTEDDIEKIAEENVCPEATVIWNAYNHDIPLRGVSLPTQNQ